MAFKTIYLGSNLSLGQRSIEWNLIYCHNEYLKYIEFKEKNTGNYIGISFLIKNTLILIVTFSYFYFYKFLNKAKDTIKKSEKKLEQTNHNATNKTADSNEMVDNL